MHSWRWRGRNERLRLHQHRVGLGRNATTLHIFKSVILSGILHFGCEAVVGVGKPLGNRRLMQKETTKDFRIQIISTTYVKLHREGKRYGRLVQLALFIV